MKAFLLHRDRGFGGFSHALSTLDNPQKTREMPACSFAGTLALRAHSLAGEGARATYDRNQAENDVPQPQDLLAWGFTKTNPCCISVSW